MKRTLIIVLAIVLAFSVVLMSCKKEEEAKPVKIGALIPLTGPLAEFGKGFRLAGDLVAEQMAEAGFPIEIKYADHWSRGGQVFLENLVDDHLGILSIPVVILVF